MDNSSKPLQVLCFGAGAIGVYIGGSLSLHGNQVTFLERPEISSELIEKGIHLEIEGKPHALTGYRLASSLDEALSHSSYDAMIFAVKSYDTNAAIEVLATARGRLPPLVCFQNGVENEGSLAQALGQDKVIPGTVTSAVGRRAAGDIILERLRGVGIAAGHPTAPRLAEKMNQAGLNARLYQNAASMKWSKLLTNLPANATSAILDMTPADIFADRGLYGLEIQSLREALSVMRAQKIVLSDLPGTPVRLFGVTVRLPTWFSRLILPGALGGGRGAKMPSFHIDLHNRRGKSEVSYLNGAVARFGESLGIPTPANRFLTDTLIALTNSELPIDKFSKNPEKLLSEFANQS